MTTISGTGDADLITPMEVSPSVVGGAPSDADDSINAGEGNDSVDAGGGDDTVGGGLGDDRLDGGSGNDSVFADSGDDVVLGGPGQDTLLGWTGNDWFEMGTVNDLREVFIFGGDDIDTISFAPGDVLLRSSLPFEGVEVLAFFGSTTLRGNAGRDDWDFSATSTIGSYALRIDGGGGRDRIVAGASFDVLCGGGGDDRLFGGIGSDSLYGGKGADTLSGGEEIDYYEEVDAGDVIIERPNGGDGDVIRTAFSRTLDANVEDLELIGRSDVDGTGNGLDNEVIGNRGRNLLSGAEGDDIIDGAAGDDTLHGGLGADEVFGSAGADVFRYLAPEEGGDVIGDLRADDRIEISAAGFGGGLVAGVALSGLQFVVNTTGLATRKGIGQFIWERDAKALWWDHDGKGGDAAVLIATLDPAFSKVPVTADTLVIA